MGASETLEMTGHLIDSGALSRVLDDILDLGADYAIERFDVGKGPDTPSYARLVVTTADPSSLDSLVMRLQAFGANRVDVGNAVLQAAPADGVFPADFYSTTNLDTQVWLGGRWVAVDRAEMDCGLVAAADEASVRAVPVADVREGQLVVCGTTGVRVAAPATSSSATQQFEFMNSGVSSERPQVLAVRRVAEEMRQTRARGQRILWVAGPAVVHTGAAPSLAALVRAGYVDVLFAGNALATHDIEASLYGTSLGVDLGRGSVLEHGHEHHIRAINHVRAAGSIAAAVESGLLTSGVMHALVTTGTPFVLVGSVRDDGPLPDVYTDVLEGQAAMRAQLPGVGYALMVATMLHAIATGNILPASVPLVCVDINPATVTKLADRGSAQATGVVTDIGLFLEQLATELA